MRITAVPTEIANRLAVPPAVSDSILPFFEPTPSSLEAWLDTLSKCDIIATSQKILPALETMNLTQIPGETRYMLSENIRPFVFESLKQQETTLLDANFPLNASNSEGVRVNSYLQQALTDAYNAVILSEAFIAIQEANPSTNKKTSEHAAVPNFNEQEQATIIHRALQSIGMTLLRCAQSYQSEPVNIWDQANALYDLAETHMMHQLVISDSDFKRHPESTIEELFKRLHFFKLAVPNRFRQRDIQAIYHLLEDSAGQIELSETAEDGSANYFIDINSSQAAQHISKLGESGDSLRFFCTGAFIDYLKSDGVVIKTKSELIDLNASKTRLPARTINRLLQCWYKISSRQFERQAEALEVTIYPGLQNIIKKLLNVPDTEKAKGTLRRAKIDEAFGNSLAHLQLIPHESDELKEQFTENLRNEKAIETLLKASKSNTSKLDIWKQASRTKPSGVTRTVDGKIADSSAKGYQLNFEGHNEPFIKVGDLIGISQGPSQIEIAVIRHLSTKGKKSLSLGVELIAPDAQVAKIVNEDDEIRSRSVIILAGIPAIKQPPSILSISQLSVDRNQLILMIDEQKHSYEIIKLLETNPAFSHYTLQRLES